jgi:hypothetical protein
VLDRMLVRLVDRSAEEAVRTARQADGVAGFVVGPALIAGPGPATVAAVSRIGPVLVLWGVHGDRREVVGAARRLAEYGARWVAVQAALDGDTLVAVADALHAVGAVPVAIALDADVDDARVASLGLGRSRGRTVSRLAAAGAAAGFVGMLCTAGDLGVIAQAAPSMHRIVDGAGSSDAVGAALEGGATYVIVSAEVAAGLGR